MQFQLKGNRFLAAGAWSHLEKANHKFVQSRCKSARAEPKPISLTDSPVCSHNEWDLLEVINDLFYAWSLIFTIKYIINYILCRKVNA